MTNKTTIKETKILTKTQATALWKKNFPEYYTYYHTRDHNLVSLAQVHQSGFLAALQLTGRMEVQ